MSCRRYRLISKLIAFPLVMVIRLVYHLMENKKHTNELQNLTYSNNTLSISNGNNVIIENDNFDWLYPDGKKGYYPSDKH